MTEEEKGLPDIIRDLCKSSAYDAHDRRKIKEYYLHQPPSKETLRKLRYDLHVTSDSVRGFLLCGNKDCGSNYEGFDCHNPDRIPEDSDEFIQKCEKAELYRGMP